MLANHTIMEPYMLAARLLTAAVAVPLVLAIIILGGNLGFFLLVFVVVGVSLYEYFTFIYPQKVNIQIIAHTALGLLLPIAFYLGYPEMVVSAVAFIFIFATAFALFRVTDPAKQGGKSLYASVRYLLRGLSPLLPHPVAEAPPRNRVGGAGGGH